jgi:hypothetical protein
MPALARPARVTPVAIAVAALVAGTSPAAPPGRVTIRGNGADLGETPVVADLKAPLAAGNYVLEPSGGGATLPAWALTVDGKSLLAFVLPALKADAAATYTLRPSDDRRPSGVTFQARGADTRILLDGKPFTEYRIEGGPKPYLYPILGPTGAPMTRAYPMESVEGEDRDHPHQRSFWFTHGKVNGIDFWSEQGRHGTIRQRGHETISAHGPSPLVQMTTTNDWLGPDGAKVCEDQRALRFYNTRSIRVIDFDIMIKATAGPVTFGDTKEGMFGLRVASSMDVKRKGGGKITNAEGITDTDAWGKASPWVDYAGPVGGQAVGIAILNHPDSFRYPTTWHVRDYGLFAANPFGWHDFGLKKSGDYTIPQGESIHFAYRVIFHKGDTASADLPAAFKAYTNPPRVEFQAL